MRDTWGRYARYLHDSLIYEDRVRREPITDVFQRAYELLAISYERAMEIDTSMISIADVPGDAMQCRTYIQNRSAFIYLGYCASDFKTNDYLQWRLRSIVNRPNSAKFTFASGYNNRSFPILIDVAVAYPTLIGMYPMRLSRIAWKKKCAKKVRRLQIEVSNWDK